MNQLYNRFDLPKRSDLAGADYLFDNDYFSMIIFGPMLSPKVTMIRLKELPKKKKKNL